jgi:glycerol-3-phosphate dehydrogenase (NAD(P)+)
MKVTILGAGAFGTALSQILLDNQQEVVLYDINKQIVEDINKHHQNSKYFLTTALNVNTTATTNLVEALDNASVVIFAIPTSFTQDVAKQVAPLLKKTTIIVNASKGFDPQTNNRMSETLRNIITTNRSEIVSLIGPGFAKEIIKKQYTTICSVSIDLDMAKIVQQLFSNTYFRVYTLADEIGAEFGVASKNVMAIASGMLTGLGATINTKAGLITRGLTEMIRYGVFFGGKKETYMGLCGLGDLVLTALSDESRNYSLGVKIGQSANPREVLANNNQTVEGLKTCKIIYETAKQHNISMPITSAIYRVLYENAPVIAEIEGLMTRKLKDED